MQVKLLVAALFTSLPLLASAQSSVTVYGVADAAIAREDNGSPDGSRTVVASGNQSSSRIGFRGTEDIGNGLKAIFNLEAGVQLDSGKSDGDLFGRRAVVGLEGNFGQVTIGREYTPVADVAGASDINGQGFYGTNLNSFGAGRMTRRISDSVSYKSPTMAGFKFGAAYGAGEQFAGPSQNLAGASVTYTLGNLYLGVAYHNVERDLDGGDKERAFGAAYKIGAFEIRGNYLTADPTGPDNQYEQANLGASFTFGANKLFANAQRSEITGGAAGNGLSIAYSYALSNRTNVYAAYATILNNDSGMFSLKSAGSGPVTVAADADPRALTVGLRHSF